MPWFSWLLLIHEQEFAGKAGAGEAKVLPETFVYGGEQEGISVAPGITKDHGTEVAAKVVGKVLGVAKRATIVIPQMSFGGPTGPPNSPPDWATWHRLDERFLDSLIRIMEDVLTPDAAGNTKVGRAIINYSRGQFEDLSMFRPSTHRMMCKSSSRSYYPILPP